MKNKKAFSMVEICVVGGILVCLLVPVFTLMSKGSSGTIKNRNDILAQQHASNVIAYVNALPYDDEFLNVTDEKIVGSLTIKAGENLIDLDMKEDMFKRTMQIKEFPATEEWPYGYKLVTVNVEWQQQGEKKIRNVKMTGLVAK